MSRLGRLAEGSSLASNTLFSVAEESAAKADLAEMMRIAERWLPSPKLRHPCPDWRFDVMTRGASPVR
jgi:hypothetical protein